MSIFSAILEKLGLKQETPEKPAAEKPKPAAGSVPYTDSQH
jgi:hypothetical protein